MWQFLRLLLLFVALPVVLLATQVTRQGVRDARDYTERHNADVLPELKVEVTERIGRGEPSKDVATDVSIRIHKDGRVAQHSPLS